MMTSRRVSDLHALLAGPLLVLDTETTGLDSRAAIVQIAVVDQAGVVRGDTLVDPQCPIPHRVTAIHGITDADVVGAPTIPDLWPWLSDLLTGQVVVAYNAAFDHRMLEQAAARYGLAMPSATWCCAMEAVTMLTQGRRRCSLATACGLLGVAHEGRHRALGDARATLGLLRALLVAHR